ncbi:MAG TPA: hypothetical protein VIY08_08125 [Candidatus Nitrosocosmicus sp.]
MVSPQILVLSLFSHDRLSKKSLLFKSFTGLTVQQFDDIYDKGISKRYAKYELQRLFKKGRKRDIGSGGHFKLYLLAYVFKLYKKFSSIF